MDAFEITALSGGLVLLVFGVLYLFAPERVKAIHVRCLPRGIRLGKSATPFQERIICRLAGLGLLLLAAVLLKALF